jgi:hypothetical protein
VSDASPELDALPRVVARSRVGVALAFAVLLPVFTRGLVLEPWLWLGTAAALALSHFGIVAWVRRAPATIRGRSLRRAMLLLTVLAFAVAIPPANLLAAKPIAIHRWPSMATYVVVFALVPAAVGWVLVSNSLPEALREPDAGRPRWRPSRRAIRIAWIAWLPGTLVGFLLLNGLTADTSCFVDAMCSMGIPHRFTRFGGREGSSSMSWDHFARDLALLATLLPAALAAAASRVRWVFVTYLVVIGGWLGIETMQAWEGLDGLQLWKGVLRRMLG